MSEQQQTQFYSVAIAYETNYKDQGKVTEYFRFCNCNHKTVHELRAILISEGLRLPVNAKLDIVILPWQIRGFEIYRQDQFFNYEQSNMKQTVFDKEQKVI